MPLRVLRGKKIISVSSVSSVAKNILFTSSVASSHNSRKLLLAHLANLPPTSAKIFKNDGKFFQIYGKKTEILGNFPKFSKLCKTT